MLERRRAQAFVRSLIDRVFQEAHERGLKPKCEGKWRWYSDFKPAQRPSPEGAERLCAGCPLLRECRDFAHQMAPGIAYGVYGGQTWIDGVIQTD